jgi:diguanylate cyclase (GGDEF)-like protein
MDRLLRHIHAITRQRHRGELAVAVAAALYDLVDARHVSIYKSFAPPGDLLVGMVAEADRAGVRGYDDGVSWPAGTTSVSRFPHLRDRLRRDGNYWVMATPEAAHQIFELHQDDRLFGFVEIQSDRPLDGQQQAIVEGLLGVMNNCIAMLDYSETDTLTGLLNRKTFDQYLRTILSGLDGAGERYRLPGLPHRRQRHVGVDRHWLGVLDLDHFKQVNDRYGHLVGDEVLILLANMMRLSFRNQDKLFRFGGEEFIVLLKPTEFDNALATFDRFRQEVEAHQFPQGCRITISIGFTGIGVRDTPAAILGNADEALYWAKENGRNRTCSYEQLIDEGSLRPQPDRAEAELF